MLYMINLLAGGRKKIMLPLLAFRGSLIRPHASPAWLSLEIWGKGLHVCQLCLSSNMQHSGSELGHDEEAVAILHF